MDYFVVAVIMVLFRKQSFLQYSGGQVDAIWSDSLIEDGDDDDNDDSGNDIDYEEVVEIVSEVMWI